MKGVGRTVQLGYEAIFGKDEEEVAQDGAPRPSMREDFLSPTERAMLGLMEGVPEIPGQVGRGASEVGHRTALGLAETLPPRGRGERAARRPFAERIADPEGEQLDMTDRRAANVRASRELAREEYPEPETGLGLAANIGTQFAGEGALFMMPGALASRGAQAAQAAGGTGRFLNFLARPQGLAQRAAQNFLTGAPIDVVISQAGAEESMSGALAMLTGDEELADVASDAVSRGTYEVLTGWVLGQGLGEGLEALGRRRAVPRAQRLGRMAAAAEFSGTPAPAMVQAIEELPPNLRQAALEAFGAEQDRLRAPDAAAPEGVQPSAPPPEQRTIRRRIAEAADPSVRQELEEAYTDPKTGLRNQTAFSRAKSRLDADPNTELVIVDLDNFKAVNDAHGLEAGDEILGEVGKIMQRLGLEQRQLFRAGGDEFVIAAPKGEGARLGKAVQDALGERPIEGTEFTLSARFGVGETFRAADEAAATAKKASGKLRARDLATRQEAPGGVSRETPAGRAPEVLEAPGAPAARAEAPSAEAARPAELGAEAPEAEPVRARTEEARRSFAEIAAAAAARPFGRAALGAAGGAVVGGPSEEVTAGQGALVGAAVALGLPGLARRINRITPGQAGFATSGRGPLQGRYYSQATRALEEPKAPTRQSGEGWLAYLKNKGVTQDELDSIARGLTPARPTDYRRTTATAARLRGTGLLENGHLVDMVAEEMQNQSVGGQWTSPNIAARNLVNRGRISTEQEKEILEAIWDPSIEDFRQTFTKEEVAKIVEEKGLRSRITESVRAGDEDIDQDALADLQSDLETRQEELSDMEIRLEDYESGGDAHSDVRLEAEDRASRYVEELDDALREEGGLLSDKQRDELNARIVELAEEGADNERGSTRTMELIRDEVRDTIGDDTFFERWDLDDGSGLEDAVQRWRDLATYARETQDTIDELHNDISSLRAQIEEAEEGGADLAAGYEQWTQPGGRDYHEIIVQIDEGEHGFKGHHTERDPFAFSRAKIRDTFDGLEVYHVEESQSDLHQQGREQGYKPDRLPAGWVVRPVELERDAMAIATRFYGEGVAERAAPYVARGELPPGMQNQPDPGTWQWIVVDGKGRIRAHGHAGTAAKEMALRNNNLAPDVPFKSTEDWTLVNVKRALWQAIEEGADAMTWVSGQQAADNYNFARYGVTRVEFNQRTRAFRAYKGNQVATEQIATVDGRGSLNDLLGRDVAEELLAKAPVEGPPAKIEWNGGTEQLDRLALGRADRVHGRFEGVGVIEVSQATGGFRWEQTYRQGGHGYEMRADYEAPNGDRYFAIREPTEGGTLELNIYHLPAGHVDEGDANVLWRSTVLIDQEAANLAFTNQLRILGLPVEEIGYRVEVETGYNEVNLTQIVDRLDEVDAFVRGVGGKGSSDDLLRLEFDRGVQIGGHAMKQYYDVIYTGVVRKYLRSLKLDAKIEPFRVSEVGVLVGDEWVESATTTRPTQGFPENQARALNRLVNNTQEAVELLGMEPREPAGVEDLATRIRFMANQVRRYVVEGSSGPAAIQKTIDEQGLFATPELLEAWKQRIELYPEIREIQTWEAPVTNLGVRLTPELIAKIKTEGQRLGYLHPALLRPLAGAAIGATGGAAVADEVGLSPAFGAFLGASVGAGLGFVGMGRYRPSPGARRAAETFNVLERRIDPEEVGTRALAPTAQAGERLPSAGKFYENPQAIRADLVSPVEIIGKLGEAMDEAMPALGLKVATGRVPRSRNPLLQTLGIFKARQQVIRQVDISDVPVFGHEAGHAMHKLFFGSTPRGNLSNADLKALPGPIRGELDDLSKGISDESLAEGWAEFWRRYLDNPDVLPREAPNTLRFVEERLEGFPELRASWQNARADWTRYRESDALSRVWSKISVGDRDAPALSIEERWSRARTIVLDDMEPVRRLVEKIREGVGVEDFADEADSLARLSRGSVGVGMHVLEHGMIDFRTLRKIGPGLKQIIAPVVEDLDDFRIYMVARRAQELHGRDKLTGFRNEDVDASVRQLDAQHGDRFTEAFKGVQEWNEGLLKYLRDSGVISSDSYDAILELNQSYVPFYRVREGGSAGGLGETYGHLFSPIKRLKGSGLDVIDPLESLAKNAMVYTQIAQKQQVSRALASLANKPGVGSVLEKLGSPIKRVELTLGEIEKQLAEILPGSDELLARVRRLAQERYDAATAGMTPGEILTSGITLDDPAEEVLAFFRPGDYMGKPNVISVLQDGRRAWYEVDKELYAALEGLNTEQLDGWARWLGIPARTLRAGATLAPEFLIRNPLRDQVMAFIQSEYGYVPGVDMARGIFELFRRGEAYQQWLSAGGYRAALTSLDRKSMQNAVTNLVEGGGIRNVLKTPFDALQALSALMEDATRMGEFLNARAQQHAFGGAHGFKGRVQLALGKGAKGPYAKETLQQAALASREVSIDFARHGAKTAAIRNLSAFWNARLQGYERMARAAHEDPVGFTAKAFAIITVPSLLEYYSNMDDPDYWEKAQWERDLFWHFRIGDDWVVVPKPFELGLIFGTLPVRILDSAIKGPGGGHELRAFLEEFAGGQVSGLLPSPTAIEPLIENAVNYSFFLRRPIVPESEEEVRVQYQAGPYTSEVAKMLARWTHRIPIASEFIGSPREIDNLLFAWTGGLGRVATELADPLLEGRLPFTSGDVPPIGGRATDVPGIRGVLDPQAGFNSESIARFYQVYEEARVATSSLRYLERSGNVEAYEAELADPAFSDLRQREPTLRAAAADLAELRAQVEAIRRDQEMSPEDKRAAVDALGRVARELAQSALGRELPGGGG